MINIQYITHYLKYSTIPIIIYERFIVLKLFKYMWNVKESIERAERIGIVEISFVFPDLFIVDLK